MKNRCRVIALALLMVMGATQLAWGTSQYYHFDDNVPPVGWIASSYKTVPKGVSFKTTLLSCTAVDGTNQGSKGVLMKPVRSDQYQYAYKKVLPGYQNYVLLGASQTYSRSIRIDQQAVGTSYVDDKGYWYF